MYEVNVEQLAQKAADERDVELVERKGLGHPDSLCDAIANHASVALCSEYKQVFGRILHHNLDKAMLVAGSSRPALGGGTLDKPMRWIIGDRATIAYKGKTIDVPGIVIQAAKDWIRQNLRFVDPDRHVVYQTEIKPGSPELTDLFERDGVGANDTSAAIGFAPLSQTESLVLSLERHLNSAEFKKHFPESGEDVKLMGLRRDRELHLTIAMAFVDRFITSNRTYFQRKDEIRQHLLDYTRALGPGFRSIRVDLNVLDDPRRSKDGMYLSVLGTSAEGGDSGQVGRGNRANGLISFNRPQSMEAHAGKNPINHIGKIYSYFTHHVARQIYRSVNGIREIYVYLCSQIGRPIEDPMMSSLKVVLKPGVSLKDVEGPAESVFKEELARMNEFRALLASDVFYSQWEEKQVPTLPLPARFEQDLEAMK